MTAPGSRTRIEVPPLRHDSPTASSGGLAREGRAPMTGDDFTRAAEIAYQRHFAERERLWERAPEELDSLPRAEALIVEMVLDDWLRRQERAIAPLRAILARLEAGAVDPASELGQELAKVAEDPEGFRERLDWWFRQQGDLGYELGVARAGTWLATGQHARALKAFGLITGRDWLATFKKKAEEFHVLPDDAPSEVLSVVWQLIAETAERAATARLAGKSPPTYENQRAALAKALDYTISKTLGGEKRKPRRDTPGKAEAFATPDADPAPTEGGEGLSPEEELTLKLLLEGADNLSKREEESLILRYVEGLEGEALGEALGTAPATARVHIHNAIKKIQKFA